MRWTLERGVPTSMTMAHSKDDSTEACAAPDSANRRRLFMRPIARELWISLLVPLGAAILAATACYFAAYAAFAVLVAALGSVGSLPLILLLSRDRVWSTAVAEDEMAEAAVCWIAVRRSTWATTLGASAVLVAGVYVGCCIGIEVVLAGHLGFGVVALVFWLRAREQTVVIQKLVQHGETLFVAHSFDPHRPARKVRPTVDVARGQVTIDGVALHLAGGVETLARATEAAPKTDSPYRSGR